MWECATCRQLNDKDNESCVFCDSPKVVVPKRKEIKKQEKNNESGIDNSKIEDCMKILNEKFNNDGLLNNDESSGLLNKFINLHLQKIKNIQEKKSEIEKYFKERNHNSENLKYILEIIDLITSKKEISSEQIQKLLLIKINMKYVIILIMIIMVLTKTMIY